MRQLAARCATALLVLTAMAPAARADGSLVVFAAASTTNAIQEIATAFEADGHGSVTTVFDATSRAARQIVQGAPAQVLVSANTLWADWLVACGPGDQATRHTIASNALVLIVSAADVPTNSEPWAAGHPALAASRLAIADPTSVPAGIYARQALQHIGVWEAVTPRLLTGDNVRTVLGWVAAGAAGAGIVYATDAAISSDVSVAATIPPGADAPILYEALATKEAGSRAAAFLTYLQEPKAQAIFVRFGFLPVTGETSPRPPANSPPQCG